MKKHTSPSIKLLALSLGLAAAGLCQNVNAASASWDAGASTQDWNTAANWSGDTFPTGSFPDGVATINVATGLYPIISANSAFTPSDIKIGDGAGNSGRLDQTAGSAAGGSGNWFFVGVNSGTGTYNLANTGTTGGTLTGFGQGTGSFTNTGNFWVGGADSNGTGTGTLNMNTSGTLSAGYVSVASNGASANGTINLDNGTIQSGGEIHIGRDGTGILNMSGGTVNSASYFVIGRNTGANGTFNLSGGTVNAATGGGTFSTIASTEGVSGTLSVSGGTFNSINGLLVGEAFFTGSGTATAIVNVSGTGLVNTGINGITLAVQNKSKGTINLNGGTIQTGRLSQGTGTGGGTFNFNGGTLKATVTSGTFMQGLTAANVLAGGAIINSNGFDVTIGQALLSGTTNDGGLTKNGAGRLTLTGVSTYTGATTISNGTLATGSGGSVNSSSGITINGSGAKLVQNSSTALTPAITLTQGTLDGTTTVGAVTVGAGTGGIVTNGDGGATALTIGSLTFNGAATTNISLNGFSGGGLAVTGALTTSGSGVLVNVVNNTTWTSGTYNLISYGSFSGALANFTKGTIPGLGVRQSSVLVNTGNSIGLAIAGDTPFWTGAESADWTTAAIGGDKNWALVTDNTPTDFINGDVALFDDNANRVDVNITGNVSPVIMNIEGGNNFTFSSTNGSIITTSGTAVPAVTVNKNGSGSAAISTNNNFGTGAVTVSGGLLALSGSNSYTGATAVNAGGVLSVQNSGALGASSGVTVASGAELQVQGNITVDRPITLSGSGLGSGALHNVSGSNTWSGPVTLGADSTIQSDAGTLVLAGGTLAGSGQALTLTGSGDGVVSSVIGTGTGTVTKDGLGTWTLTGSNTYTGATTVASGTLNVTTGGVINNTAVTSISGASGGSAVLNIAGGSLTTTAGNNVWDSTVNVGYTSGGAGALKLGSGTLSVSKQLGLGNNGGYGAYTQTGGTASVGGFLALGLGTSAGVFNQSGGTYTQAGPVTDGADAGGIGVINLSGSAVYNQTSTGDNGLWVGESGTGMLNVSGSASLSIVSGNNGLQLGRNASGVGVVNLLGGTVTAKAVYTGSGAGTLNFNGGTLKANIANTSFLTGLTNAYVYSGGGTIDNGGFGITIGQALLATSGSGVSASGLAITGGSGYIDTPVVVVSGGGGTGATAVATVSGGVVTGITITNPGIGYTSVPTFTLNGGGGSGASIGAGTATVVANTSGGLTFTGTGTTTLTGTNTYTGATVINGGAILSLGSGGTTGSLSTSSSIVNNGTLKVNRSNDVVQGTDFSGAAITGTGAVSKAGAGILTLNTANSFTGGVAFPGGVNIGNQGAVRVAVNGAIGSGAISMPAQNNSPMAIELIGGVSVSNDIVTASRESSSGVNDLPFLRNVSGNNTYSGNVTANSTGGGVCMESQAGLLTVSGNISTNGVIAERGLWLQGSGDGLITGAILHNTTGFRVDKRGSGTWTLAGNNTYQGTTTVTQGMLSVTGTVGSTSSVSVSAGATLDVAGVINSAATTTVAGLLKGTGSLGAVSVTTGTVAPGASPGTLSTGAFTLASTAVLAFELQSGNVTIGNNINDLIAVTGNLTLDGTLNVTELGGSLVNGSTYRLFNYTGSTLTNNTLDISPAFLALHPGSSIDTSVANQVNLLVVPEPGTFAMLLGGVGMLTLFRRRKA